jgi:hypothetical protein
MFSQYTRLVFGELYLFCPRIIHMTSDLSYIIHTGELHPYFLKQPNMHNIQQFHPVCYVQYAVTITRHDNIQCVMYSTL